VILRPLPDLAPANPAVAGAALDPDGTTRLVLDPDGLVAQARHATGTDVRPDTARPPILVVDDSLTTRMLEQSILESVGYTVDTASSAELALDKARDTRYGLFLVDVEMPGIDGFTLIERMRADADLRDIPAILVTSRAAPEDRRRGVEVGADGYVLKGEFDQTALLQRIGTLLVAPHADLAAR
jgi:two-component system, chemotaxis family, sensor kinase CheA